MTNVFSAFKAGLLYDIMKRYKITGARLMKNERILVLNMGSTSSKIAVYINETELFKETIRHSTEELEKFDDITDQFEFRREKVMNCLAENGITESFFTAVCSRGGNILPCPHGAIAIDQAMIDYLTRPEDTAKHASLLGSMIAFDLHKKYGIPACIYDAIGTDEMVPLARVSGVPELPHNTVGHTLNTRAMAIKCAHTILNKKFRDSTIIVAHLGGGGSIRLYKGGINVDSINDDQGSFYPERGGGVNAKDLIPLCYSGKYTEKEMMKKFHGGGGFVAHLGTSDAMEVEKRIKDGDGYAALILEAFAYNVAKDIGSLAAAASGKVDRIILTGGVAYSEYVTGYIKEHVSFIAPVEIMPGEIEMEALAHGTLRVLRGAEELQDFSEVAKTVEDRIRIYPGLKPYTAPKYDK